MIFVVLNTQAADYPPAAAPPLGPPPHKIVDPLKGIIVICNLHPVISALQVSGMIDVCVMCSLVLA